MFLKSCFISIAILLLGVCVAIAEPITYIYTGTGSGTIGGTPFTDATFTITGQADTDDLANCSSPDCQDVAHLNTNIVINGVGTYTITSPLRTFLYTGGPTAVGLSWVDGFGFDLYDLENNLAGWDLVSSWGPVNCSGMLIQWGFSSVNTSGGVLFFEEDFDVAATFQAILLQQASIPTLSEWGMIIMSLILAGSAFWMIRRRQAL